MADALASEASVYDMRVQVPPFALHTRLAAQTVGALGCDPREVGSIPTSLIHDAYKAF